MIDVIKTKEEILHDLANHLNIIDAILHTIEAGTIDIDIIIELRKRSLDSINCIRELRALIIK